MRKPWRDSSSASGLGGDPSAGKPVQIAVALDRLWLTRYTTRALGRRPRSDPNHRTPADGIASALDELSPVRYTNRVVEQRLRSD